MIDTCPACGALPSGRRITTRSGELLECNDCATLWRETGGEYAGYGDDYFALRGHIGERENVRDAKIKTFRYFWRQAGPVAGFAGLEIGCATGWGLVAGRDLGMDMRGMDVAEESKRYAIERGFSEGTVVSNLSDLGATRFRVVGFFDALEHIPDPKPFLRMLRTHLDDEAELIIVIPRADGIARALLGQLWPHYIPDHWVHYSRKGMEALLKGCGYSLIRTFSPTKWITPLTLARHVLIHSQVNFPAPTWPIFPFNIGEAGYIARIDKCP